jgi:hypothetical protein
MDQSLERRGKIKSGGRREGNTKCQKVGQELKIRKNSLPFACNKIFFH